MEEENTIITDEGKMYVYPKTTEIWIDGKKNEVPNETENIILQAEKYLKK